jgi:hypothetical protein
LASSTQSRPSATLRTRSATSPSFVNLQATTRGDTTTFSNEKGQVTGRAERRGNTTNFFNQNGQMIGSWR